LNTYTQFKEQSEKGVKMQDNSLSDCILDDSLGLIIQHSTISSTKNRLNHSHA